jgi:hypothetical protein
MEPHTITDYKIVLGAISRGSETTDKEEFAQKIRAALREGFIFHGDTQCAITKSGVQLSQAFIK